MPIIDIDVSDILEFRLPRWDELPEIELYMDQVVSTLEKKLEVFAEDESQKLITSTMINNYVKQKVVKPPVKKRYGRLQLSYLFVVCILKRIMNISDICESIEVLLKEYRAQNAYDIFCDELENAIHLVFTGEPLSNGFGKQDLPQEIVAVRAAVMAVANLLLAHRIIRAKKELTKSE